MPKTVILTVPHCIPLEYTNERTSDTNSLKMAHILKTKLKQQIQTIIITSKQNRYILDDNRYSNKNNKYTIKQDSGLWNNLRIIINNLFDSYYLYCMTKIKYLILKDKNTEIKPIRQPKIFIIDCHSFYLGGFGKYSDIKLEHEVVILDYKPYQQITESLTLELNNNGIKASLLDGQIGGNSILDVFTLHPILIQTVLLEIREDLSESRLNEIADIVSNVLLKH